jgi:probable rRNA maturation factor
MSVRIRSRKTERGTKQSLTAAPFALSGTTLLYRIPTPGLARREIRAFANKLASDVAQGGVFSCLITSDGELRRLNREFRKEDYPTDVLSFPHRNPNWFLGDIAISFETARRQASEHGHGVGPEIEILMLHGLLHLLGMDHETDRGRMARAEKKWRGALGLPHGLTERVRR